MKLTNKQALLLFEIAKDSLSYPERNFGDLDRATRVRLVEEILKQQGDALVDLERAADPQPGEPTVKCPDCGKSNVEHKPTFGNPNTYLCPNCRKTFEV